MNITGPLIVREPENNILVLYFFPALKMRRISRIPFFEEFENRPHAIIVTIAGHRALELFKGCKCIRRSFGFSF